VKTRFEKSEDHGLSEAEPRQFVVDSSIREKPNDRFERAAPYLGEETGKIVYNQWLTESRSDPVESRRLRLKFDDLSRPGPKNQRA